MTPTIVVCEMESGSLLLDGSKIPVTPGGDRGDAGGAMGSDNDSQWDIWNDEI